MKQSRRMSLVESMANVVVGYGVALAAQSVVFPCFDIHITMSDGMAIGAIMTLVSIVRSYTLRRLFAAARGQ